VLARIRAARAPLLLYELTELAGPVAKPRHPVDDVHHQLAPIEAAEA